MLAARAAGRGDVLFRQRQGARVDLLVLAVLAHGGPLPRGVLGGSPDAYREAGFRRGIATSTSTSSGTTSRFQFCPIRSYLSTAAKHSNDVFDALGMLTDGRSWPLAN
jgi:hypothetical protein